MKLVKLHEDLAYAQPASRPSISERLLSFHELPDIVQRAYLNIQPYESVKKACLVHDYDNTPVYVVTDIDGVEHGYYEDGSVANDEMSMDL